MVLERTKRVPTRSSDSKGRREGLEKEESGYCMPIGDKMETGHYNPLKA